MSDIVERLGYQATLMLPNNPTILLKNAADKIERLRDLNETYKHDARNQRDIVEQLLKRIEELEKQHIITDDEIERLREELAGWETIRESYYHLEDLLTKKNKRIEEFKKQHIITADEIERLREDWRVISQEKAVLLKRIEELEKQHIITDEQIDAAWRVANCFSPETNSYAQEPLKELGIERCEGCGGVGSGWVNNDPDAEGSYEVVCSHCDGHRWVKDA